MATENSGNHVRNILVLLENAIPKSECDSFIKYFVNVNDLIEYVYAHIKDADNFHLHVPGVHLEKLIEKCIHKIKEVRRIHVYYATNDTLQSGQIYFLTGSDDSEKLDFHLERDLDKQLGNAEAGGAVDPSRPVDRTTIDNIANLQIDRLHAKRRNSSDSCSPDPKRRTSSDCRSPDPKRFAPAVEDGLLMQHVNSRFICPSCEVFFQEPYQLECGHRLCKLCLNTQNRCLICRKFIVKEKAWFDRGFENEKQRLLTTCLQCEWTGPLKFYQGHLNENHHASSKYSISNE